MTISFACTNRELGLIDACARRALAIDTEANEQPRSMKDWQMDFSAVHANGCPMDFERLMDADDFNFAHDAFGIARHLDRDDASPTGGQLLNCFLPRFAAKEQGAVKGDTNFTRKVAKVARADFEARKAGKAARR